MQSERPAGTKRLHAGSPPRPGRLDFIDGLRAIAVLVVFVTHVTEIFVRVTPGRILYTVTWDANFGRVGVVTFFAISGFLIPSSLYGTMVGGALRFMITRVFRLFPAFWLSVGFSAATYTLMTQGQHLTWHEGLLNLTMVPRLFGVPMANGAYWTLEVELTFYALCLILFVGGVLRNTFVLAALMAVLFGLFYSSQAPILGGLLNPRLDGDTFFFDLNLSCMFWGAVLRRWWDGERPDPASITLFATFSIYWLFYMPAKLALATLHLLSVSVDYRLVAGYSIGLWLFLLGMFVVRLRWRPLILFGRISYSFYLLHQAGLYAVYAVVLHVPELRDRFMELYILASLTLSTALATGCFLLVEAPFIRMGRRLSRGLPQESHPVLAA